MPPPPGGIPPPGMPSQPMYVQHQQPPPPQGMLPPQQQPSSMQQQRVMTGSAPPPHGMAPNYPVRKPTPPVSPQPPAPSYLPEKTKVILVTGYRRTGKTTVAKELAKIRGYEYLSLRGGETEGEDGDDETKEDEEEASESLVIRFAPLQRLLERKNEVRGIVLDDVLMKNKFEPYYVNFLLEKAGLNINSMVVITVELNDLVRRGVSFSSHEEMQAHPESFEFGEQVEEANTPKDAPDSVGTPIVVVDGKLPLDQVASEAIRQLQEVDMRSPPSLSLPTVNFIPACPLVTDPGLVEEIIGAEVAALGALEYGFPYVEPNYLLDYSQFVRKALLFQGYLLVPWIWGAKVSLIGYGDDVFVHLPSYRVVFQLKDISTPLHELIVQLKAERAKAVEASEGAMPEKPFLFSLEGVMQNDVIYISDMMLLGEHRGSEMTLAARVQLLKKSLGKLPSSGPLQLLEHYPVNEIGKCMEAYKDVARGVLFVNPDGMQPGMYDSRNFIYACEDKKTVQLRIWSGRMDDAGNWIFEAYARNNEDEQIVTYADTPTPIQVYIPDEQVGEFAINDGNIIECMMDPNGTPSPPPPAVKGKKNGKAQSNYPHFIFVKRCNWQVTPTTAYYQGAFVAPPSWATAEFLDACGNIPYKEVVAPA